MLLYTANHLRYGRNVLDFQGTTIFCNACVTLVSERIKRKTEKVYFESLFSEVQMANNS